MSAASIDLDFRTSDDYKAWWSIAYPKLRNQSIYSKGAAIWNAALARATPQHSVTEQDSVGDDPKFMELLYNLDAAQLGSQYPEAIKEVIAYIDSRAQPLASTAATQPEQASIKTWQERVNLDEYEPERRESVALYEAQREIADLRAALAIPASTATTQQENEQANVLPPFAAPAGQHDASELVQANEIMRKALEDIAQPADAGCGCSFPCRCNDDAAEVINAWVMRGIASDTLVEVDRRFRAQGGSTNNDSAPASTAPAAAVRAAERIDAMHKGVVGVFAAIKAEHTASTAASEQPKKSATCSMLDIIRTMVFTVDQFAASSSPNDPPPWALNSPVVLAARRLCYEYGYETGDLIPAPAASEQQASVSEAQPWREAFRKTYPNYPLESIKPSDALTWAEKEIADLRSALSGRATIPSDADERAPSDDWIMDEYKRIVAYPERLSSGDYATAIKLVRSALTHRAITENQHVEKTESAVGLANGAGPGNAGRGLDSVTGKGQT